MKITKRSLVLSMILFALTGCDQAKEKQVQQLSADVEALTRSLVELKEEQRAFLSEVKKHDVSRAGRDAAIELSQKTLLSRIGEISESGKRLEARTDDVLELSQKVPEEKFEILTIELDEVGRKISDRIQSIKQKNQVLTIEQKKQVALLQRRNRDLSMMLRPPNRSGGFPMERRKEDLSEEEQKKVADLRTEISTLEDEIGHLMPATSNSFQGADIARKFLVRGYQGTRAVIFNRGFHGGSDERFIYLPEGTKTIDITPTVTQQIDAMEDGDDVFQVEGQ